MNIPKWIILHHTAGTESDPLADTSHHTFAIVNEYHRKKFNFKSSLGTYIGYHYFIDKQGVITQGRADTDEGAHTIGKNKESLGICLAGNFDLTYPTDIQLQVLKKLLREKSAQYKIPLINIVPHRRFSEKTCYGTKLYDNFASDICRISILEQIVESLLKVVKLLKNK